MWLFGSRHSSAKQCKRLVTRPSNKFHPELTELEERSVPAALNLTTGGAVAIANNAVFQQISPNPSGCGVFRPFVRLQNDGTEQGLNTNGPLVMNELTSKQFTHALQLGDVPESSISGIKYREFVLDINQANARPYLSLDELRVFVDGTGSQGYDRAAKTLTDGKTAIYDLGNNWVNLNGGIHPGLGTADAIVYIPSQLFGSNPAAYVYLYSKFGATEAASGGFEQWTEVSNPAGITPPTLSPASISGHVVDGTGAGLGGVTVTLTGTDIGGNAVTLTAITNQSGYYQFQSVAPGTYSISSAPLSGYTAGLASAGTVNGTTDGTGGLGHITSISLNWGDTGMNYDLLELASPVPPRSVIIA